MGVVLSQLFTYSVGIHLSFPGAVRWLAIKVGSPISSNINLLFVKGNGTAAAAHSKRVPTKSTARTVALYTWTIHQVKNK